MRIRVSLMSLVVATGVMAPVALFAQETPAETTTQPAAVAPSASPAPITPARGSTMDMVKEKFGAPSQEAPAVGQPPITRWDYPGYVVFFENDRVLHTVIVR